MTDSPLQILPAGTGVETARSSWRDLLGVAASVSCAIHCAVMPIAIGYLPAFAVDFLADETFHKWMVLICLLIAITAFIPGWRRHKKFVPSIVGALGLSVIATAAFAVPDTCCSEDQALVSTEANGEELVVCTDACCQDSESASSEDSTGDSAVLTKISEAGLGIFLTPLGGLLLVVGHLLNHRLTCRRECCSEFPEC